MDRRQEKLSWKVLLGYGSGDVGGNLFFTAIGFWFMIYLTDEIGLSATLAGVIAMVGKFWDAFMDPAVGALSDRTRSRWGRRRPWLLFSAVPLGLCMFLMFSNPHIDDKGALFLWALVSFVVLNTVYSFVNIPYNALTPDLTKDYNEKTKLNGFRMIFAVTGTLIGAGLALPIIDSMPDKTSGYQLMGGVFGIVMIVFALVPFFTVKEPPLPAQTEKSTSVLRSYLEAFRNVPFLLIVLPWTLNIVGITIVTSGIVYYFKYLFHDESLTTPAMLALLLTAIAFIVLIIVFSKKIGAFGKKKVYIVGMSVFCTAVLAIFFVGHLLPVTVTFLLLVVAGIGFSTHYVMPWAIVPDTIEYDYAQTGERKEGVYYGLWTFMTKIGQAFAVFFVGLVLDLFGYVKPVADQVVAQSDHVLLGIRLLVGPFTAVFFILANVILFFYPIDQKKYRDIEEKIRARDEGKSGAESER